MTIPGTEGRAGMATVVVGRDFDPIAFRQHLAERLARVRPAFVCAAPRCGSRLTATFKSKKQELCREGYDPAATADAIYFDDRARDAFVKLDAALYERIRTGNLRL